MVVALSTVNVHAERRCAHRSIHSERDSSRASPESFGTFMPVNVARAPNYCRANSFTYSDFVVGRAKLRKASVLRADATTSATFASREVPPR